MVEKYRIIEENIYNFDEKGFMIRIGITLAWIITHKKLASNKIIKVS